jgi:hypothetical protein
MPVGVAVCEAGKARSGISFAVRREDQGELIDRVGEMHIPERTRKFEGSEGGGVAEFDLIIEDQKAGQPVQGDELSRQGALPAGRLDCPSRAVDRFRHSARRECDSSESPLAEAEQADITERLGQGQRLCDERPRSLQVPGIHADAPGDQERSCQPFRAATPAQD